MIKLIHHHHFDGQTAEGRVWIMGRFGNVGSGPQGNLILNGSVQCDIHPEKVQDKGDRDRHGQAVIQRGHELIST